MTQRQAQRNFKKHYKKAMKLKEGGKAWEREINFAHRWLEIGKNLYNIEIQKKYLRS